MTPGSTRRPGNPKAVAMAMTWRPLRVVGRGRRGRRVSPMGGMCGRRKGDDVDSRLHCFCLVFRVRKVGLAGLCTCNSPSAAHRSVLARRNEPCTRLGKTAHSARGSQPFRSALGSTFHSSKFAKAISSHSCQPHDRAPANFLPCAIESPDHQPPAASMPNRPQSAMSAATLRQATVNGTVQQA